MKTITSLLLAVTLLSSAALADGPQDKDHPLTKTSRKLSWGRCTSRSHALNPCKSHSNVESPCCTRSGMKRPKRNSWTSQERPNVRDGSLGCGHEFVARAMESAGCEGVGPRVERGKGRRENGEESQSRERAYIAAVKQFYGGSKKRALTRAKNYSAAMKNAYQAVS